MLSAGDDAELLHQPEVVAHRPVLDDLAVAHAEDVSELHRDLLALLRGDAAEAVGLPCRFADAVDDDPVAFGDDYLLGPSLVGRRRAEN